MSSIIFYDLDEKTLATGRRLPAPVAATLNNIRTELIHDRLAMRPEQDIKYFCAEAAISAQISLLDALLEGNVDQLSSYPIKL